jgi:predicted GH43/DUF377 family glycosyl hydrolase
MSLMRWDKRGHVYVASGHRPWAQARALPVTPLVRDGVLRLYSAFCDADTVGRVGWVDVDLDDPTRVLAVSDEPVLDIGEPGTFDDSGVAPTAVVPVGDELYMYYVGYQRSSRVPYFQLEGLAVSADGGETFQRRSRVPVLERSHSELHHRSSAFVTTDGGLFRMWYVAGGEWIEVGGKRLPTYNLRYLESPDGITWPSAGAVCLHFSDEDEHAFARPWVTRRDGEYELFYSIRTRSKDYRLGYAVSSDGLAWDRRDDTLGLDVSASGWDSESIEYPSIVDHGDRRYLFYCGNGCGRTGFGYAEFMGWTSPGPSRM